MLLGFRCRCSVERAPNAERRTPNAGAGHSSSKGSEGYRGFRHKNALRMKIRGPNRRRKDEMSSVELHRGVVYFPPHLWSNDL